MKHHKFALLVIIAAVLLASNLAEATNTKDKDYRGTTTAVFLRRAAILRSGGYSPPSPKGSDQRGPGHR
ncbi:hypothetical protein J5N97_007483 [Dioscorea zingiberensis]|uniref:Uncharacterized protein n=1 Tax=Dioscorea zingiberensis TaxID=325984 RepID=A0A9D5DF88_9LILI|nr:hypothetical protein J5N97_007483 [Dioscorea zingiberensis]